MVRLYSAIGALLLILAQAGYIYYLSGRCSNLKVVNKQTNTELDSCKGLILLNDKTMDKYVKKVSKVEIPVIEDNSTVDDDIDKLWDYQRINLLGEVKHAL